MGMTIKELTSRGEIGVKNVEVHLTYEECRDLANGMFEYLSILRENKDINKFNRYKDMYKKVSKLFHIVKTGWLLDDDLRCINHTIREIEEVYE